VTIAGGDAHSVAVRPDGTVWAWGSNAYGELGIGSVSNNSCTCIPNAVPVTGLGQATSVAAGDYGSLALKPDGTVWAWGYGTSGENGNGTTSSTPTPVQVSGLTGVTAIERGFFFGVALKSDGTVWAWGGNYAGNLGDGTTTNHSTPVQVSGLAAVTAISTHKNHTLALKSDGTVWGWGQNDYGVLGAGGDRHTPAQIQGLTGTVTAIYAGSGTDYVRTSDGNAWAWGKGDNGELGNGSSVASMTPVRVHVTGVTAIVAERNAAIALRSDGTVWTWGLNDHGQLGNGSVFPANVCPCLGFPTPQMVPGLYGVTTIAAGGQGQGIGHGLVSTGDGAVWAWGFNWRGEIGDGTWQTTGCWCAPSPKHVMGPIAVTLTAPSALTISGGAYAPATFTVSARISNGWANAAPNPEASLQLPRGFSFASDTAVHHVADVASGSAVTTSWNVNAPAPDTMGSQTPFRFRVFVSTPAGVDAQGYADISIPPGETPGAVTGMTVTGGPGQAFVSWTPPAVGQPLASYTVTMTQVGQPSPIATQTVAAGDSPSTVFSSLANDCAISYLFAVTANNGFNGGSSGSTTVSSAFAATGHPAAPPAAVVIYIKGLGSSEPGGTFKPLDPGSVPTYCNLAGNAPNNLLKFMATDADPHAGDSYQPWPAGARDLTDALAMQGAVVLPYSYNGAYLSGTVNDPNPVFAMAAYDKSAVSVNLPNAGALKYLVDEVTSVHNVWPSTRILIVGHSNGGAVAEQLWEQQPQVASNNNVWQVFSLDSPINGVDAPGLPALLYTGLKYGGWDLSGLSGGMVSNALADFYIDRWQRKTDNGANLVPNLGGTYVPIGTVGDPVYEFMDLILQVTSQHPGFDSQVPLQSFPSASYANVLGPVPYGDVIAPRVQPLPLAGVATGAGLVGHDWVKKQPEIVNCIAAAATSFCDPSSIPYPSGISVDGHSYAATTLPRVGATYVGGAGIAPLPCAVAPCPPPLTTAQGVFFQQSPLVVNPGQPIAVAGWGFGASAGSVSFASKDSNPANMTVVAWSDTQIVGLVPTNADAGPVVVTTALGRSSGATWAGVLQTLNTVANLSVAGTPAYNGEMATIAMTATDLNGAVVASAPVLYVEPRGVVATGVTDVNGVATLHLADFGTVPALAISGQAYTQYQMTWSTPPAMAMSLSAGAGSAVVGTGVTLTAHVTDAGGVPAAGQSVTFLTSPSPSSLSVGTAVTNASGDAMTVVSSSVGGNVVVTAVADHDAVVVSVDLPFAPAIQAISPSSGVISGGTIVTVTGAGFSQGVRLAIGGLPANVLSVTGSTITATTPPGLESGSATVALVIGTTATTAAAATFTYVSAPVVGAVSPRSGPLAGGTAIQITGSNFDSTATVLVGTVPAANVTVQSPTQITATVPAGETLGAADVTVSTSQGGGSTIVGTDQFVYSP
jgi:alpha-tubulin suppressor-like RCC1 family protein